MVESKISRGLDTRERERHLTRHPLDILKGAPTSIKSLKQFASRAVNSAERMAVLADAITADLERFKSEAWAELSDRGKIRGDGGLITDTWNDNGRQAELQKLMAERSKIARRTSDEERLKIRRDFQALREQISAVSEDFGDPVNIIYSRTLASERRNVIAQNLMRQSVRACGAAMRQALASGDIELAAAALDRFDQLTDSERDHIGISKQDFASQLVGSDLDSAKRLLLTIQIAGEQIELDNAQAEGKDTARLRQRVGRLQRDLEALGPEPEESTPPVAPTKPAAKVEKFPSDEDLLSRARAKNDEIMAAALRGEFAPDGASNAADPR